VGSEEQEFCFDNSVLAVVCIALPVFVVVAVG